MAEVGGVGEVTELPGVGNTVREGKGGASENIITMTEAM